MTLAYITSTILFFSKLRSKLTLWIDVDTAALSKYLEDKVEVKGKVQHFKNYYNTLISCQELNETIHAGQLYFEL